MEMIKRFIRYNRQWARKLERKYPRLFGQMAYKSELIHRIEQTIQANGVKTVLEAGGIDRPMLQKGCGYVYDGLDIESRERCYEIYDHFIVQTIEDPVPR